jgi:beta-N-acetylhexosaminidase
MTASKAFICGCAGLVLSPQERGFIRGERPWGLILFLRNICEPPQIVELIAQFRDLVEREDAPVLVDQEGGRVQRLGPPHWPKYPPAALFRRLPGGIEAQAEAVRLAARLMAVDLRGLGISVDCMPVLDVPDPKGHAVIGDRAYSDEPGAVAELGRAALEGMLAGGVLPVVKHIPGHGRAQADSHLELPVVRADLASLREIDFAPFRALASAPLAMTAHVVYTAIDPERPATLSRKVISEAIRGDIGFQGLLLSDDLSMRALSGGFGERARAAFEAGVDVALHCNGDLSEAAAVAKASPALEGASLARARRALDMVAGEPEALDLVDARARLQSLLAMAA